MLITLARRAADPQVARYLAARAAASFVESLRAQAAARMLYVAHVDARWHGCNLCVGNGLATVAGIVVGDAVTGACTAASAVPSGGSTVWPCGAAGAAAGEATYEVVRRM
jgi:hypothetical protein